MIVLWSPHAETLLDDIVIGIAEALSIDDGLRWEGKLRTAAAGKGSYKQVPTKASQRQRPSLSCSFSFSFCFAANHAFIRTL